MTPGTWPAWRSFRATPLPVSLRGVADNDAVAMMIVPEMRETLRSLLSASVLYSQEAASSLPCGRRVLLVEQRAHTLLRVRESNRLRQELADREDDEALEPAMLRNR